MNSDLGIFQYRVEEYNRKPDDLEQDLVYIIAEFLKETVSEYSKEIFINAPMIKEIKDKHSNAQRAVINRFFSRLLFMFRATKDIRVDSVIFMLNDDGYVEDWMTINKMYLFPFLKKCEIFETLYPRKI